MYSGDSTLVTITLDPSYTRDPEASKQAVDDLLVDSGIFTEEFTPETTSYSRID